MLNNNNPIRKLRVFVGSPGDVNQERDLVSLIVEELRRGVARLAAVELESIRWETHAWPAVGTDAQDVINREIGDYDVFVGIMWKRFGTPTRRAPSGSAEEFQRAYEYFTKYEKPKIMFYFCTMPFYPSGIAEVRQISKILEFKRRLQKFGVLFWEYREPIEFERRFREHLTNQIVELGAVREVEQTNKPPRIFLSYKRQDLDRVEPIYEALKVAGFSPWIDVRDILPGSQWIREIEKAIRSAHFFITFVSRNSVDTNVGSVTSFSVNTEVAVAVEKFSEPQQSDPEVAPDPHSYIIPARLDPVAPPTEIAQFQWVDLFEPQGLASLIETVRSVWERRL